jgi:polyhydroxybutyrate depolymerase
MVRIERWTILSMLFSLSIAMAGCTFTRNGRFTSMNYSSHTLTVDGITRTYLLIEPLTETAQPLPLILALHGGGGTARSMCLMPGGLAAPALREGYLLVCPQGVERHWNDGRAIQTWRSHAEDIDDVGFLIALVDHLLQLYDIDDERIFATGISNGGQMSYRLACEQSSRVVGIAPVVASMAVSLECQPGNPVSILVINGTEDPLIPFDGGEITALRRGLGSVKATREVLEFWARSNQCGQEAESIQIPELDPHDGTRVIQHEYSPCLNGSLVELYEIVAGGHTWPGANQYLPEFLIGRLSQEMQASEVIIEFFNGLPSRMDA